jgi:hypothetical protein
MKKLIFAFILIFGTTSSLCQSLDNNVVIQQVNQNQLYTGHNLIAVLYKVDSFRHILVTSSKGEVNSVDKYLHSINLKQKGKVLISVYDISDGKRTLLNQKNFTVDTVILSKAEKVAMERSRLCNLSIDGFTGLKIPLTVAKKATKFTVNAPCKIKTATIYVGTHEVMIYQIKSGDFDAGLLEILKRIVPGTIISLDNIIVTDEKNKSYSIEGKSFSVIND